MSRRVTHTAEEKYRILKEYEETHISQEELCKKYSISESILRVWRNKYRRNGYEGLELSKTWRKYSSELKQEAVREYLNSSQSMSEICFKYKISSISVLRKWIKKYNSHSDLKSTVRGVKTMTKSRKTTIEERLEIVEYCISNEKNYHKAAKKFKVSYQQVYGWVRKYEQSGLEGLQDNRGKQKIKENLTDQEKLELRLKRLELENTRLKAENLLLKKLEELGRK